MKRREAYEKHEKLNAVLQTIPADSPLIYDAFTIFDEWKPDTKYAPRTTLRRGNVLYITGETEHTSQADWLPEDTPALYTVIPRPDESGTADNPIEYNGNMKLEAGKYYKQDNKIYYCYRDTGNPVFAPLSALVDQFVMVYA